MSFLNRNFGRGGGNSSGSNNNTNKPVCKFYLEGKCRYGESCHNYHPPPGGSSGSSSNQNLPYHLNRDAIKSDLTVGDDRPGWPLSSYGPGKDAPRQLLEGTLEQSPEELRVQYYLGKAAGNTQQYEQQEASAISEAGSRAQQILSDLDSAIKYVIDGKDLHPNREDMTLKPNVPFTWVEKPSFSPEGPASGAASNQQSAFGNNTSSALGKHATMGSNSTFGQPATSSPFGGQTSSSSAFGRPSAVGGGSSAFGQPSALGNSTSAFGKPSSLGGGSPFGARASTTTSAFGQPSSLGGNSPFGQAPSNVGSTFGQASNSGASPFGQTSNSGTPAFGQASTPGTTSAFGQPSTLGGGSQFGKPSPFGAASSSTPAFGSSTFGNSAASSAPAFGQSSQPGQQTSPFGQQPSTFGQSSQQPSAFGQPSQPGQQPSPFGQASHSSAQPSAFGQASQPGQQASPFAKASPFASTTSAPTFGQSSFGSPSPLGNASNNNTATPFGQSTTTQSPAPKPSPFGATSSPFGNATNSSTSNSTSNPFAASKPTTSSPFASTNNPTTPSHPPTSLKGRTITRNPTDGHSYYTNPTTNKKERVWFPDGPPAVLQNPDVEASPETYAAIGQALQGVYSFVRQKGVFEGGVMPEVPPRREWVSWDL